MNQERETPESDAFQWAPKPAPAFTVRTNDEWLDFARRLERQRDEALGELAVCKAFHKVAVAERDLARHREDKRTQQRDELQSSIQDLSHPNCRMLIKERDEAREALDELRIFREIRGLGTCQCSDEDACRYARERDAARRQRDELREALVEINGFAGYADAPKTASLHELAVLEANLAQCETIAAKALANTQPQP